MALDYRKDIDGLRAVAILLVVIFHFNIFSIGKAGFIGVDVFFVISGFLIGGIISRDLAAGKFRIGTFLYRRVRRLYPAMLATLVIYLAVGYFVFLPDLFNELVTEALLSQLYVVNLYFWQNVNYFGLQVEQVPLLHMWSLSLEEQFYLFFPIGCVLIYRLWPRGLLPVTVVIGVASFLLGLWLTEPMPWASFYLLPTRAWEFLAGVALALIVVPRHRLFALAAPLGFLLIAIAIAIHTPTTGVPGWFALLPTLAAVLIIAGGSGSPDAVSTRLLSTPVMTWFGRISYPLYLVHWPVLITMKNLLPDYELPARIAGLMLSIFLGWLVHILVELPIKGQRVLPTARGFLAAAGSLSLALIAICAFAMIGKGWPDRFSPQVQNLLAYQSDAPVAFARCNFQTRGDNGLCPLGSSDGPTSVLVIGDSHSRALAPALDLWMTQTGQAGTLGFYPACMPVHGFGNKGCARFTSAMIDRAIADPKINHVVLVSIWRQAFEAGGITYNGQWLDGDRVQATMIRQLTQMRERLAAANVSLTVIDPMYAAPRRVPETLAKNAAFGFSWSVDTPLTQHEATFADVYSAFDSAELPRISLTTDLCEGGICPGVYEGRPVFTDNNHIATSMAPYFAAILKRELIVN